MDNEELEKLESLCYREITLDGSRICRATDLMLRMVFGDEGFGVIVHSKPTRKTPKKEHRVTFCFWADDELYDAIVGRISSVFFENFDEECSKVLSRKR